MEQLQPCTHNPGLRATLTVLITELQHVGKKLGFDNSKRKRILYSFNQLCIRRSLKGKLCERKEEENKIARSLFQYNLEKMTDLGWSCCQNR